VLSIDINVILTTEYYLFGETRLSTGNMFTDRLFTGQRQMAGLGIYQFGARFYSPELGRFLSADPMGQNIANPQAFNRYSYASNNPVRYTDPTGYWVDEGCGTSMCRDTTTSGISVISGTRVGNSSDGYISGGSGGDGGNVNQDGDGYPEVPDPSYPSVTIGTSMGCDESTYVECFYARELLEINGNLEIDNDQFNLLMIATFYDITNRDRTASSRTRYDTPFWDAGGDAPGTVCFSGDCYDRVEVNYFAQGMWSAANREPLWYGEEVIVGSWKRLNYTLNPGTYSQ